MINVEWSITNTQCQMLYSNGWMSNALKIYNVKCSITNAKCQMLNNKCQMSNAP